MDKYFTTVTARHSESWFTFVRRFYQRSAVSNLYTNVAVGT